MTRTAENLSWLILAQHHYAQETAQVMHALMLQRVEAFTIPREEVDSFAAGVHGLGAMQLARTGTSWNA